MKSKTVIEERYDEIKMRHMNLIKMAEEKAVKMPTSSAPLLPNDLMFVIFLLLPVRSLLKFTCVCKVWYKLIHCAEFVEAYNAQAEITPIVCRYSKANEKIPNTFHVETQLNLSENFCLFPNSSCSSGIRESKCIYFLEMENDRCKLVESNISLTGSVVASYNGLVLINSMSKFIDAGTNFSVDKPLVDSQNLGRLIVVNPVTRILTGFPLGTLPSEHRNESYGLTFSQAKGVYIVVHLYKDNFGYFACEILSFQTRSWKAIDGPPGALFSNLGQAPILTVGALHWTPGSASHDYIISMVVDDEQFSKIDLPTTMRLYDRLVEMGGFLSFVNNLDEDHVINVWVLKALEGSEWVKQYTIRTDVIFALAIVDNMDYALPAFAVNANEMVFRRRKLFYWYSFELEQIREIKLDDESIMEHETIMPHFSNLATWESLEPISS